jgi:hypothetical protein
MPNVILIGGSNRLMDYFRKSARWKVQRALFERPVSRDTLGDPRRWHLIVDEGKSYDGANEEGAPANVSSDYVSEATRAHYIRLHDPPEPENDMFYVSSTSGHYDLEFNPCNEPGAEHLLDFVEKFRTVFGRFHFEVGVFPWTTPPFSVLFKNHYGRALVVLTRLRPLGLHIIGIPDEDARFEALAYLVDRTVPKLWPEAMSDQFRPRRVLELERELESLVASHRERSDALERRIQDERDFYAAHAGLTEVADHPLKHLVRKALEDVFSLRVIDLDEEIGEGDSKTLDLVAEYRGAKVFLEVKASGDRGARIDDLEDMDEHTPRVQERHGSPAGRAFVFNGRYRKEPKERTVDRLFSGDVVREAQKRGICLLATSRLLDAIEARRNEEVSDSRFFDALQKPGLFELSP